MQASQQISVEEYYSRCSWRVPIVLFVKRKQDVQIYIHKKRCKAPTTLEKWTERHSITISGSSLKTTVKIGIFKADQLQSCTGRIQDYPRAGEDGENKQFRPHKY